MKRFLLFVMVCVCVSIGAWAEKYSTSFGTGSSFEKNGTTLYVDVQNPGDWATYVNDNSNSVSSVISGCSTIKFSGNPSQADINKSGSWPLQLNGQTTRLDLYDVTSNVTAGGDVNNIKGCILPKGSVAPDNTDFTYVIAPLNDVNGQKAVTVSRKQYNNDTGWQNDEYVTDADYIFLKGNFTEADKTSLESVFGEGKVLMDGELDPRIPLDDLTINDVSSKPVSQQIQEFLNTPKNIRALTINCEMDNIEVLNGLTVQTLDLSRVTNADLGGLVLPTITDEAADILLPYGVKYNSGVVTSTSGQGNADQLKAELNALKNSGKEVTSATFPDGSTYNAGVLTAQTNTSEFLEAAIGGGLDVSKVVFPDGAVWENGVLTFTSASETDMNDIVGALESAGFVLNSVVLSSGTKWTGGTVTLSGSDDIATMKAKFDAAGLETEGVIFTNGTKFENGKLTTVAADETGINGTLKTRAEGIREVFGENSIKSLLMSDHTEWNNGTVTVADGVDHTDLLNNAGFTVSNTDTYDFAGTYVTEKNGVITLTIPTGMTFSDIKDLLSSDENNKLKNATSLKIVGTTGDFTGSGLKDKLGNGLKTLDLSETIIPETMNLTGLECRTGLTTLTLPSGGYFTKIPESFCNGFTSLSSVNIPSQVTTIGKAAFQDCTSLSNIDWEDDCHVETIEESAFQRANISGDFVMPNSVRFIEAQAFDHNNNMKSLTFSEYSNIERIGASAFAQSEDTSGKLGDVYINVKPAREIECAHGAFDKYHAAAQTRVGTVTTRLHYPREYYEYYVGSYKSTLYDPNLDYVDETTNETKHAYGVITQDIINRSFAGAANGWQEFMSSGIPVGEGSLYRTYSESVSHLVPDEKRLQIYLVHDYSKTENLAYCVQMQEGDLIPANTGFIIHSGVVATIYLPFSKAVANPFNHESHPDTKYRKGGAGDGYNNYLKPINGTMKIYNVEVEDGKKTYRNFFFNNGTTAASRPGPDWEKNKDKYAVLGWGFFRAATYEYTVWNKAFLHLPAEMTEATTGRIDDSGVLPQDQGGSASAAESFGIYIIDPIVFEEELGIATSLNNTVENKVYDDAYYTLQGVKVDNPSAKGIYIHNGKKVLVK